MPKETFLSVTPTISCDNAAITLGILEEDLNQLIEENKIKLVSNYSDKPAITTNDLKSISRIQKISEMRAKRFSRIKGYLEEHERQGLQLGLDERYSKLIGFMESKIGRLEEIFNNLYQKMEMKQKNRRY